MNEKDKDASLLFHEIPLFSRLCKKSSPEEIFVTEGVDDIEDIESATFSEAGGGVSLKLADLTRIICWRTQGNTLEIFEYSLDIELHSNHFIIVFEDSQLLPSLHISIAKNFLKLVCCTVHAAHCIILDIGSAGRQKEIKSGQTYPSLLMNLRTFDFENPKFNYSYGHQIQGLSNNFSAGTFVPVQGGSHDSGTIIGLTTSGGNIVLVTIPGKGQPSHVLINQTSRMSRLWSGINPWAGSSGSDSVSDLKIITLEDRAYLAAVFKDHKLRIWCCQTQELAATYDLHDHIPGNPQEANQAFECKIQVNIEIGMLSIYISSVDQANFLHLKVESNTRNNSVGVEYVSLLTSPLSAQNIPSRHLVDYTLSSNNQLHVLWHDVEDIDSMSVCQIDVGIWHDVAMYPTPTAEVPLQPYQDVREAYMDLIFTPGHFSQLAIARALTMHRRSGSTIGPEHSLQDLKEKVSAHIQHEIQNNALEEDEDVDYHNDEVQEKSWNTFYQTCIQYQHVLSRSLGLTTDLSKDGQLLMSVIKKGFMSVLTPVSSLEAVCRGSSSSALLGILQSEGYTGRHLKDLCKLIDCLGTLHGLLGIDLLNSIEQSLCSGGNNPADVIEDIMPDILDVTREFLESSSPNNLLAEVEDIPSAIKMLLVCLEPTDLGVEFDAPDVKGWPVGPHGIEVMGRCTMHHIKNRFQLTTLLCILSFILETLQTQNTRSHEDEMHLSARVTCFVQAYQAVCWLSSVETPILSQTSLESTMHSLSMHDLNESRFGSHAPKVTGTVFNRGTLLEFFLSAEGGKYLQAYLKAPRASSNQINSPENIAIPFHSTFNFKFIPIAVNYVLYLMWPLGPTLVLPDFMLTHGIYTVLKRYLQRNLGTWCNWCPKSRAYMLAHCHLKYGDYDKAVRSFILAASGIGMEDYLVTKLLREDEDNLHPTAQEIIYYTQVLQIFEKLDLPEQVIALAHHAIQVAKTQEYDPNLPTLWSSVFRQSNLLSRHFDAFKAIVLNPDPDHRKDCLRALAVSLCERTEYKTLIEFQYDDLEDDLVSILEHRARGTDLALASHNYYDLLYAFYVHRGNFRRAASAMYEQGYRLGREFSSATSAIVTSLQSLQRQLACFVTCIDCLHLVAADNRWILHPVASQMIDGPNFQHGGKSPKRQYDGEEAQTRQQRRVVIKELGDIQKESLMIETRIKLSQLSKDPSKSMTGPLVTPAELVAFLCHAGLYDDAILISVKFNLSLVAVFESLASKCVHLSYVDEREVAEAWEWLQENETAKVYCSRAKNSTTPADEAYRLLQVYLEKYGDVKSKGTTYYRAVAKSLLSLSATLPAWFSNAYKERNCPELLRLLVCFDRLEEATTIAVELIDTTRIRIGADLYSHKKYSGTWLPYTIIEQLMTVLEDSRMQDQNDELFMWLNDTLDEYLHVAETVSEDMILVVR